MTRDYDWSISHTARLSNEDFQEICNDYEQYKVSMTEDEAWWEALSLNLMNQDINTYAIPYVIVAQMLKDCKNYYKTQY